MMRLGQAQRAVYRYVLRIARRYAAWRTDRDEPVLLCWALEADVVRDVGRRLHAVGLAASERDSTLLGSREIVDWLLGTAERDRLVRAIQERRDLERRWWRYSPPDILDAEAPPLGLDIVYGAEAGDTLKGRAISPGYARGKARVVNGLGEATRVLPGEVLVCRVPAFELSPFFGIVSAVVSEVGGLLDHAATLAREYGVPAVFGVPNATGIIRTGDDLQVDAVRGIIVRHVPQVDWTLLDGE